MTQKIVNIGTVANSKGGDPLRVAFDKINQNFAEVYTNLVGGGTSVTVAATAPSLPTEGNLWWDSADGTLYIRYSNTWIEASPVATPPTIPDQTGNTGKYLTTNGADLSWATVAGGASTGDLAFISNALYNLNGVVVENADLTHGATAALVLPVNGNTTMPVQLNNFYGDVTITSGTDISHTHPWTFGKDGRLTFPDGTIQSSAYAPQAVPASSPGKTGDKYGMIAGDLNYFYFCTRDYTGGGQNIWRRVALDADYSWTNP